ncbi:MAG: hypothetical protein ABJD38_20065, partial [Aurantimonas coralicida]
MDQGLYRKLAAYAGAAVLVLVAWYPGVDLSGTDDTWVELAILVAGGYGVYAPPAAPRDYRHGKAR